MGPIRQLVKKRTGQWREAIKKRGDGEHESSMQMTEESLEGIKAG
jgi:hypothetical protein